MTKRQTAEQTYDVTITIAAVGHTETATATAQDEECESCGIVNFTVRDGFCRQCANLVDEFQGEIANLY